ncbi:hypothetical protein ERO13_D07G055700v2 [Gossypium hirsutum]|uniref:F-box protein At1g67340 n=1 Tax=Gossypium hirsutum TaxID=3635 RepID=A0A1U8MW70_GOSHI|nr:F-box protein At1g67340-like [Gossypium hirsutum]KAG4137177.1 hypothetical protein ERO13_D07G055700v2 [Gossypium hirsutum]
MEENSRGISPRRSKRSTVHKIAAANEPNLFDALPDDLVVSVLCKLSSSAASSSDFINALLTCKRFKRLGFHQLVLSNVGSKVLAVKAKNWSDSVHRFLIHCVNAGNVEACYTLGMIRFYSLQNRGSGMSLMAKAAVKSYAPALYSLAVIQFNGSGGSRTDKDLQAGVALCARAAFLGHVDALRELGHCFQDGYGIRQNITAGRRLLMQANTRELASLLKSLVKQQPNHHHHHRGLNYEQFNCISGSGCSSMSNEPASEGHPVNVFLKEWFELGLGEMGEGLRLCSHKGCGRPETRAHEFRRCSACGTVHYCSRGCQALDWKLRHKLECVPFERWLE